MDFVDLQKSFASVPYDEDLRFSLWNNPVQRDFSIEDKYANFKVIFNDREYNFIKPVVCQLCRAFDTAAQQSIVRSSITITQPYEPELFHKVMLLLAGSPLVEIKKEEKLNFAEIIFQLEIDTENFQKKLIENLKNTMTSSNILRTAELAFKYGKKPLMDAVLEALRAKYHYEPLKDSTEVNKLSPGIFEIIIDSHNTARLAAKKRGEPVFDSFMTAFQVSNLVNSYLKVNSKLFLSDADREGFREKLISQLDFEEPIPTSKGVKKEGDGYAEIDMVLQILTAKLEKASKRLDQLEKVDMMKGNEIFGLKQKLIALEATYEKLELKNADTYIERFKAVTKGPTGSGWVHANKVDAIMFKVNKDLKLAAISIYLPHAPPKGGNPLQQQQQQQQGTGMISQSTIMPTQSTIMPNQNSKYLGQSTLPNQSTIFPTNQSYYPNMQPQQQQQVNQSIYNPNQGNMYPQSSTFGTMNQGGNMYPNMDKSNMGYMQGQQQQYQSYQNVNMSMNPIQNVEPTTLKGGLRIIEGEYLDGPVIIEKQFEVAYKMVPGKGEQTMEKVAFDHFVRLKGNQWYIITQTAFGPASFFGEGGFEVVLKGEYNFTFRPLQDFLNNNGTDMLKGQIPRLYFSP